MRLFTRRRIYFLISLLIVLRYLAWPWGVRYAITSAIDSAKKGGHRITAEDISAYGLGVRVGRLTGWLPRAPISFEVTDVTAQPALLSLLRLSPAASFALHGYEGDISGSATDLSSHPTVSLQVRGVQLPSHPQLMGLGITSGTLAGTVSDLTLEGDIPTSGRFEVTLNDLRAPQIPFVPSLLKGLDSLEQADLRIEGEIINATLNARTIDLRSSLLSMNATALCSLKPATEASPPCEAQASFTIPDSAPQNLSQWLPIISQGNLTADTRSFSVTARGEHCVRARPDAAFFNGRCWKVVRWGA